jgi:hypothetical protein
MAADSKVRLILTVHRIDTRTEGNCSCCPSTGRLRYLDYQATYWTPGAGNSLETPLQRPKPELETALEGQDNTWLTLEACSLQLDPW